MDFNNKINVNQNINLGSTKKEIVDKKPVVKSQENIPTEKSPSNPNYWQGALGVNVSFGSKIDELTEKENQRIKEFLEVETDSNQVFRDENLIEISKLNDDKYERLLNFRKVGGELYTPQLEKLCDLDDEQYEKAIGLVKDLYRQEYIVPIVSDENYYNNVQKLLQTPFLEEVKNWQKKSNILREFKKADENTLNRFISLINNGYRANEDDISSIDRTIHFGFLTELNAMQFEKANQIVKNGVANGIENIVKFTTLDEEQYQKVLDLKNMGVSESCISILITYDEETYSKYLNLVKMGMEPKANLIHLVAKLSDVEYQKAVEMQSYNVPGYDCLDGATLEGKEYEHEIEKLQTLSDNLRFEESSNTQVVLPEITKEEKADMVKILQGACKPVSEDDDISKIAHYGVQEYRTDNGVPLSYEYINKLLPYTCEKYISSGCKPMTRWLCINDLDDFIKDFPNEGEIYSYPKIQSFSKTQYGAETKHTNMFSDTNADMNVKFVVYPKSEKTQAYDTGMGKYGADETIYSANQEFKVLYKETQDKGTHQIYTIYMQEV